MSIDRRKKKLKFLRRTRYEAFEHVCQQLGITYTFPPEYYRHATRRWQAKKALCIKVTDTDSCLSGKDSCTVCNETLNDWMCHLHKQICFKASVVAVMQMPCLWCTTVIPQVSVSLPFRSSKSCRNRKQHRRLKANRR